MLRKIVLIDRERCTGCGKCAEACHEGAIEMVNGKAVLTRESYCDGLGDCLPACPAGAISFEEREAPAYDAAAVEHARRAKQSQPCACPGTAPQQLRRGGAAAPDAPSPSRLAQWPVQIKLLPVRAPYYDGADILVAADCTAYACGDFHGRFMAGRVTLIGCPKLDAVDYAQKLTEIFAQNDVRGVTVTRMQVPCCGGMENAVRRAIAASGKDLPFQVVTLSADGRILS